jgi:hypothetical protein
MDKATLIHCREVATCVYPNKGFSLRMDNDFAVDTRKECVHFDDNRELLWQVYRNDDATTGPTRPFRMIAYEYGEIQHFEVDATQEEFRQMAKKAGFSDSEIDFMMKTIILTAEDYADSVSNNVKGRTHGIIGG